MRAQRNKRLRADPISSKEGEMIEGISEAPTATDRHSPPRNAFDSDDAPEFLTVHEVAGWLRMSVRQVWTLRSLGELRAIPFSGRVTRFPRQTVLDFIARKANGG